MPRRSSTPHRPSPPPKLLARRRRVIDQVPICRPRIVRVCLCGDDGRCGKGNRESGRVWTTGYHPFSISQPGRSQGGTGTLLPRANRDRQRWARDIQKQRSRLGGTGRAVEQDSRRPLEVLSTERDNSTDGSQVRGRLASLVEERRTQSGRHREHVVVRIPRASTGYPIRTTTVRTRSRRSTWRSWSS